MYVYIYITYVPLISLNADVSTIFFTKNLLIALSFGIALDVEAHLDKDHYVEYTYHYVEYIYIDNHVEFERIENK